MKEEKLSLPDIKEIREAAASPGSIVVLKFLDRGVRGIGEDVAVTVESDSVEEASWGRIENHKANVKIYKAKVRDAKGRIYQLVIPLKRDPEPNPFLGYGWARIISITPRRLLNTNLANTSEVQSAP